MRVVVADATPLNYLILVDAIEIIPRLFEKIFIPPEVREELTRQASPPVVRSWMEQSRPWLEIPAVNPPVVEDPVLAELDPGERAAILLAEAIHADLILIDEKLGALVARERGLTVTGTLGVLDLASRAGYLDLKRAFGLLQKTNFRYPPSLMEILLKQDKNPRS